MLRPILATVALLLTLMTAAHAGDTGADFTPTNTTPGLGDYDTPFYVNGTYRPDVEEPGAFLGYPLGSKPAPPTDIIRYFEYLATNFDNVELHTYAHTYEGRPLVYLVVTSEANAARLDDIRADHRRLADPRHTSATEARRIVQGSPAVAWMAYGIHGDELSSCDAALQLAYQLVAGTDEATRKIVDELVVIIDPLQNPDGRTRWVGQLAQWNSVAPNYDIQSLHHRGVWPYGRTNHYLFDLNRDWFSLVHPESRGRTSAVLEWMPHYFLDCHEMGPTDTYMFSPPREPFNPFMASYIHKWWDRVARDHATAFDAYGWSYYTREWNEEFFPGYGSSWSIYLGAVGMLFEQAGVDGSAVKRRAGTIMTYRETVHHQFVGSMANLETVADGREELLTDYYDLKVANVSAAPAAFVFPPSPNRSRIDLFAEKLEHQHIEVERAESSFRVATAVSQTGETIRARTFPEGSLVVRTNQPLKQLIDAILTFDIRIPTAFLETERKEVLKHNRTRLYEATGWSLPHAYGLDAVYVASIPNVRTAPYSVTPPEGSIARDDSPIGYVFDGTDDRSSVLLARLLERGVKVWASRKSFENDGHVFARGSYQIRLAGNPGFDVEELRGLAEDAGVPVYGIATTLGRAPHADLGGDEFALLESPRIALVGGSPIASSDFGAIWHLLDNRLGLRTTTLDLSTLAGADIDKYNVIVLPENWGGALNYQNQLGEDGVKKLKGWVSAGGTLVATGNACAFLADTSVAVTSVRLRRQSLEKLSLYADAVDAAKAAEAATVDSLALWEGRTDADKKAGVGAGEAADKKVEDARAKTEREMLEQADERARRLHPRGAVLTADLDDEHWLTFGCAKSVPVMFDSDYAYLAKGDIDVPARLAPADRVRLAGLMWGEAKERWGETPYATREGVGKGQVILFATLPNFRGYFLGAERLLLNALLLGPGLGTAESLEW